MKIIASHNKKISSLKSAPTMARLKLYALKCEVHDSMLIIIIFHDYNSIEYYM